MVPVSFRRGTLASDSASAVSRLAHRIGRAEFLAPEIEISRAGGAAGDAQLVHYLPACRYSSGVRVRIDSAWISAFMRSPRAA